MKCNGNTLIELALEMLKIGDYNTLRVVRKVDFGVFLEGGNGVDILLPNRYVPDDLRIGDDIEVFVYTDSEDRVIATTESPYASVGQVVFLEVTAVNRIGAFLDWGLPKDLLVPFREQKTRMLEGRRYPVYVYLDDATKRVVASAKIEKYIGNLIPEYNPGEQVDAIVYKHTPMGYFCAVDNLHQGLLYENEVYEPLAVGDSLKVFVTKVRRDGKIDLRIGGNGRKREAEVCERILERMRSSGGEISIGDSSSPQEIRDAFGCSKRDFKKAVGHLLKKAKIANDTSKRLLLIEKKHKV